VENKLLTSVLQLLIDNVDTVITFFGGVILWLAKRLIGKMDAQAETLQENQEDLELRLERLEKKFVKIHTEHVLMHKNAGVVCTEEDEL
jgi:hypothetical protein